MDVEMDRLVSLCKRRGIIFPSSEIYGGINGFWDYGPLGVELKRNIKDAWWHDMVHNPPPGPDGREIAMVGVDCAIVMNPRVWEASGHVGGFADPMVDCKKCRRRYRADKVWAIQFVEMSDLTDWMKERQDTFGFDFMAVINCSSQFPKSFDFAAAIGSGLPAKQTF